MARFFLPAKPLLLAALCLAAISQGGRADAADPAVMKTLADRVVKSLTDPMRDSGWSTIVKGDAKITPAGGYDTIALPSLTFIDSRGRTLDAGQIALNVSAGPNRDEWRMAVALPGTMTVKNTAGKTVMTVNFGTQNFSGTYSIRLGAFTQINARYQNMTIDDTESGMKVALPALAITEQASKNGQAWTGAVNIGATRPHLALADGTALDFDRLAIGGTADNYTPRPAGNSTIGIPDPVAATVLGILKYGFAGEARVSSLTILAEQGKVTLPGKKEKTIATGNMNASLRGEGGEGGLVHLHWLTSLSGLTITPATPHVGSIMPSQATIDIDAANLPVAALLTAPENSVAKILSDAHATATVKNSGIGNGNYTMNADGAMAASAAAPSGATGTANVQFYGIETLANGLGEVVSNPQTPAALASPLAKLQAILTVTSLMGQPDKDKQGRPVKTYKIDMTNDGRTLLNGQDTGNLFQTQTGTKAKTKRKK